MEELNNYKQKLIEFTFYLLKLHHLIIAGIEQF